MRDIARATGLSQSTVSRVLNRKPTVIPIAEKTRERVIETARQLGYRPNPLARGLRGASTMLLGVIVRDITDPFFAGAIEAVTVEAGRRGYNVVLGHAHARADEALALWGVLEARHCDAILLLGDMRDQPRLIEDLAGARLPVIALWQGSRPADVASVSVDNRAGIHAVLDHLTGLGHRRIAFIGGRQLGDIKEREEGFIEYVARSPEALPVGYIQHGPNEPAGGVAALQRLLELPEPPTAVVASTDVLAIGALHAAHERGLRVPDRLSITGFDDIPVAAFSVPSLTTVRMPVREMVATAVRIVLDEPELRAQQPPAVLQPSLVVRASTGPVAPPTE
jgi:DNA-binding LacI/PurR family transcriptional regulator